MSGLASRVMGGDPRALARALTIVENRTPGFDDLLASLHVSDARPLRIGLTGAPGVGKSTLADGIASSMRREGHSVAILAVDPSSPFTGGAVLGDRVRMKRHLQDAGVFIRSMASRGDLGGLAPSVGDALTVLEAFGCDIVLIETAGVGQSEVDVLQVASSVAVVLAPEMGDDIQAAKAGIMEIADLFVINKADRPSADELERQVLAMVELIPEGRPRPPVLRTNALREEGIDAVAAALREVERPRPGAEYWRRRLAERIGGELRAMVANGDLSGCDLGAAAEAVAKGDLNPYVYVRETVERLRQGWTR